MRNKQIIKFNFNLKILVVTFYDYLRIKQRIFGFVKYPRVEIEKERYEQFSIQKKGSWKLSFLSIYFSFCFTTRTLRKKVKKRSQFIIIDQLV